MCSHRVSVVRLCCQNIGYYSAYIISVSMQHIINKFSLLLRKYSFYAISHSRLLSTPSAPVFEQPLLNTWTWPSPPSSVLPSLFFLPPCHLAQKQGQACPWVLHRYAWNARGVEACPRFTHLHWLLIWPTFPSNFICSAVLCLDLSTFEVWLSAGFTFTRTRGAITVLTNVSTFLFFLV